MSTASKSLHLLLSSYWLSCSLFKLSKTAVRKFIIVICTVHPYIPIVYREYVCKFSRCLQQIEFSLASKFYLNFIWIPHQSCHILNTSFRLEDLKYLTRWKNIFFKVFNCYDQELNGEIEIRCLFRGIPFFWNASLFSLGEGWNVLSTALLHFSKREMSLQSLPA